MHAQVCLDLSMVVIVTVAAVSDLATRRIPNRLLLAGWLAALLLRAAVDDTGQALVDGLAGAILGFLFFLPLYLLRGMAAGDVKLMATVGIFVGPAQAFQVAALACCVGGVMAIALIVGRNIAGPAIAHTYYLFRTLIGTRGIPSPEPAEQRASLGSIPYGLAIAVGAILSLWSRHA